MTFRPADESVTKQQYYEQAVLLSEALAHALGAIDVVLNWVDWENYPKSQATLIEQSAIARKLAKEAMSKTAEADTLPAHAMPAEPQYIEFSEWEEGFQDNGMILHIDTEGNEVAVMPALLGCNDRDPSQAGTFPMVHFELDGSPWSKCGKFKRGELWPF